MIDDAQLNNLGAVRDTLAALLADLTSESVSSPLNLADSRLKIDRAEAVRTLLDQWRKGVRDDVAEAVTMLDDFLNDDFDD